MKVYADDQSEVKDGGRDRRRERDRGRERAGGERSRTPDIGGPGGRERRDR